MSTGSQPTLKIDPEQLSKLGNQLLSAAGDLPEAPAPFIVTGSDAISQAIADKLQGIEGPIQDALPQLSNEASDTAGKVVDAAGRYASTDSQIAADYEKHQFDSAGSGGASGSGASGGGDAMSQMGQLMSTPMQMASQAAQLPMQAMSAVAQVPQSIMQGVQQIGQMTGGTGSSEASGDEQVDDGTGQPGDHHDGDKAKPDDQHGATGADAKAERAPEPAPPTAAVPQQSSPRHAAPDPRIDL